MPPCGPPVPATPEPPMQPIVDLAALLAQVQQLMQTVQALQAQNEALQDQLDAQPAAVPAAAPAPAPAPIQEMKIAMPNPYDGSSDQTEHFFHQFEVYFLGLPGLTEHQHVTFAISYMNKGQALSWAEQMVEEVTLPGYVTSWGAFKINVRTAFSDLDRVTMVQLKIKEVKQGKESVDDYVVWFEEFEGLMGFDDAALAEIFKEGLAPQICRGAMAWSTFP
jgi:hypothetical protein